MSKFLMTYSAFKKFADCRKAFKYRYIDQIVPNKKSEALIFGSIIHDCLEEWYANHDRKKIKDLVYNLCHDHNTSNMKIEALAMMDGYVKKYPSEKFDILALEKNFDGAIINPDTGVASSKLAIGGKIDGIVKKNKALYILEHKTAFMVTKSYIDKLSTDFQILLYSIYANKLYSNKPILGIIYNILVKAKTKRKSIESDRDYYLRLRDIYAHPKMFKRESVSINSYYIMKLERNIWDLSQAVIRACEMSSFYSNNSNCFQWNRPCDYYTLCYSNKVTNCLFNEFYEYSELHSELGKIKLKYRPLSYLVTKK